MILKSMKKIISLLGAQLKTLKVGYFVRIHRTSSATVQICQLTGYLVDSSETKGPAA